MELLSEGGYRIVVCHDDPGVSGSVKRILEGEDRGFDVSVSTDPDEVVEAVEDRGLDCVVCGGRVGGEDGVEVLRRVRDLGDTPFVLFLGEAPPEREREAIGAGVTDHVRMTLEEFVAGVEDPGAKGHDFLSGRLESVIERERARTSYREVFDKANDAIFVHDRETGEILDVNQRMCEMHGYTREEGLELEVEDISSVEEGYTQERAMERIEAASGGEPQVFEWRNERKDGERFWVEVNLSVASISGKERVLAVVRDISERKAREEEIERKNDLLAHTEEIADTGGWEVDAETGEQRWTKGTYDVHDLPTDYEPTVEDGISFYHPDDRDTIREAVERCREEGEPFDLELRLVTAEDRVRWVRARGEAVTEDGEVSGLRGAIQDITEMKERERRLRESEERFRALVEQSLVGIYVIKDGVFDYANPRLAEILNAEPEDVIGSSPFDYIAEEYHDRARENLTRRLKGEVDSVRYGFTGLTEKGERKRFEVHGTRIDLGDGPAIAGTLIEVGEEEE